MLPHDITGPPDESLRNSESRAGHYIFTLTLWFLSSFFYLLFFSPNLSGGKLDVYHTSTHGVALVRI